MAIQQVTSSGGNGILSFLFHDDGGMEGSVLEGAEFARTLHQLLGQQEAEAADAGFTSSDTPAPQTAGTALDVATATTAPLPALTAELETLAGDFALPAQGAELAPEAGWEAAGDGQEHEHPFWGIAPFTDVAAALREHQVNNEAAPASAAPAPDSAHTVTNATVPAPGFGKGIANLIELARDAEQLASQLTQAAPLPVPAAVPAGKTAPASGKPLPQAFRPVVNAVNVAGGPGQSRGAAVATDNAAAAAADAGFGTALSAFSTEPSNIDTRNAQNAASQNSAATLMQGIGGLRNESAAALQKPTGTASDPMTPRFDAPQLAGTEAWFEDLGARVEWLQDMNIDSAELQLHPAELGVLDIQISTGDEGTTVSFVTHNSEARELIESNMPKLRELLASQGMQLGQSQVSQQSDGQRRGHEAQAGGSAAQPEQAADEAVPQRRTVYVRDPNRIDHYV